MIDAALAALSADGLTRFAAEHVRSFDVARARAARKAHSAALRGDYDRARRLLARAGIVPEPPSLLPLDPTLAPDLDLRCAVGRVAAARTCTRGGALRFRRSAASDDLRLCPPCARAYAVAVYDAGFRAIADPA